MFRRGGSVQISSNPSNDVSAFHSNPVIIFPYTSHSRQQWPMLPESQWCEPSPFFSIALQLKPFHFSVSLNYCFRFPFLFILCWFRSLQSPSIGETSDAQKNVFDLGAFVGDLTLEEDPSRFSSLSTTFSFSSCTLELETLESKLDY